MAESHNAILSNPSVRAALQDAWAASEPGVSGGHEEGGFVTRDENGNLDVVRWPVGERDSMRVPLHQNCKFGEQMDRGDLPHSSKYRRRLFARAE